MLSKEGRYVLEVSSKTGTNTSFLGRRVDRDEDEVSLLDAFIHIGREKQITATRLSYDFLQSGFIDWEGKVGAVPSINTLLVEVNNRYLDIGALQRDDRASRSSCKAVIKTNKAGYKCRRDGYNLPT